MEQRAIFSLHACLTLKSFIPPSELKRKSGTQKVTTLENIFQGNEPLWAEGSGVELEADEVRTGGLISGTGATLLSGRVSVFARRMVAPESGGCRVVGIGTSVDGGFARKRKDMGKKDRKRACNDSNADRGKKQACCQ